MQLKKIQAWTLVKAYPQPSEKYEETVCVAAISRDGKQMLRLYPVRFRHLNKEQRFTRFELIEAQAAHDSRDGRPESHKINEDTLRLIDDISLSRIEKAKLWKPFVYESLPALRDAWREKGTSLGIIRPDPGSIRFRIKPHKDASAEDQRNSVDLVRQVSLLEKRLRPLPKPQYAFYYEFTSGGKRSNMMIHDWEVQTTYNQYLRRYESEEEALDKMRQAYNDEFPRQNLHLIMGNMKRHPHVFIIIGVLRPGLDMTMVDAQKDMFGN